MGYENKIDAINQSYNKWLISFRIANITYFTVWGYDSTVDVRENSTKILIDKNNKVLLFLNPQMVFDAILTNTTPLFDGEQLRDWATSMRSVTTVEPNEPTFDLDYLALLINESVRFNNIEDIDPKIAKGLIEIISLISDFAEQIKDAYLENLWENPSIRAFWEYLYNAHFWTIPADELKIQQKVLMQDYNGEDCKKALQKMLEIFRVRLVIISL